MSWLDSINSKGKSLNPIEGFSLNSTAKEKKYIGIYEDLRLKLQNCLNNTITVSECDSVLLAGALLVNDRDAIRDQIAFVDDINARLFGNSCQPLSKWIEKYHLLPSVKNMSKFIEGNSG